MIDLRPIKLIVNTITAGFPVTYLLRRLDDYTPSCTNEPLTSKYLRNIENEQIEEFTQLLMSESMLQSITKPSEMRWYLLVTESIIGTAKTLGFVLPHLHHIVNEPEVLHCLARMLKDTHSFELSHKYCYIALQQDRNNICVLVLLGQVCDAMKRFDEAEAVFQKAQRALTNPQKNYARLQFAFEDLLTVLIAYCKHLFIIQQYEHVIYLVEQLTDISPDFVPDTELSIIWAECYRLLGEVDRSKSILTKLT